MNQLESLLVEGLNKVASVIESNPSYDYILGDRLLKEEYERLAVDSEGNLTDQRELLDLWDWKVSETKPRVFGIDSAVRTAPVLAFATTANNRREIDFLQRLLEGQDLPSGVVNLCDLDAARQRVDQPAVKSALESAFKQFLESRSTIKRGLLHQLISFASFSLAAWKVLHTVEAKTFVVANDHSPGPVAYAKLARHFGMKTVYLQHAEVTTNFPPLDFDLSILRNRVSKNIYERVGPVTGQVMVASRDPKALDLTELRSTRQQLRTGGKLPALIYPSGVSNIESLENLYRALEENPDVSVVAVKVHPAAKNLEQFHTRNMSVRRTIPHKGHVAVCGNSSVAIELIAAGNLVFQCFDLDEITRDYYGFVRQGLTSEVRLEDADKAFWRSRSEDDLLTLADFLPNVSTRENVADSIRKRRLLSEIFSGKRLKQSEILRLRDRENLLRDVYCLTHSLVSYASEVDNLYGDDFRVIRTLDAAFARRDVELGPAYQRVGPNQARSVVEFWLAAKAIEWNGRAPTRAGRDNLMRFVRLYSANPRAKRWLENKMFDILVRFGSPDELLQLFASAEHLASDGLGANKKVAFVRFTEANPAWADRLRKLFNPNSSQVTSLEELKLSVQCMRKVDGELEYDDFRQVEHEFKRRHPIVGADYSDYVEPVYDQLGSRAAYIDVLRNSAQKRDLLDTFKTRLQDKEGYGFVRLSDGEGILFQKYSSFLTEEDSRNRQRHWWGEEIPQNLLAELLTDLEVAVADADLLGIPSVYRFLRDHSDRTKSLYDTLQGRGLLSVLQGVPHFDAPAKRYTDDKANLALFCSTDTVDELMTAARKLILVSSAAPEAASRLYGRYGGVVHIPVPTHNKTQHNMKYVSAGRPLPYVYREVNEQLQDVVRPGDLVLVGAGVAGKTFVRTARHAGAVGLDIGSAMDQLLDAGIHSLF
ncbi:hypothetical protein HGQ17_13845 [Nesterenkonia sp. MY13]|uniref:GT-D fold-like domain-containing protein n=1 Tax=Nesterenkonia sedimenti TaxID=1463632 RepID=A0A7X8TMC4_9MICC|nr:hypothetical protein [Nesterenkonia sedimenti]NLS11057.1 hypothetical protein [Nesterenkonia sedimenti]